MNAVKSRILLECRHTVYAAPTSYEHEYRSGVRSSCHKMQARLYSIFFGCSASKSTRFTNSGCYPAPSLGW